MYVVDVTSEELGIIAEALAERRKGMDHVGTETVQMDRLIEDIAHMRGNGAAPTE